MSDHEQRIADLQAEHEKAAQSWLKTRERLVYEGRVLLWLHAEARHLNDWHLKMGEIHQRWVDESMQERDEARALAEKRLAAREDWKARCLSAEGSCQAWAEEADRLQAEVAGLKAAIADIRFPLCACVPNELRAKLDPKWRGPGPVCSVHPKVGRCPNCNGPVDANWFDRSVCPAPCGAMHTRCKECGTALDGCPVDLAAVEGGEPTQ